MTGEHAVPGTFTPMRCDACGMIHAYPVGGCSACGGMDFTSVPLPGHGRINSYTVIHRAPVPAFADKVPYALACIDLDGGGRLLTPLAGELADIRIGGRVRLPAAGADDTDWPPPAELLDEAT